MKPRPDGSAGMTLFEILVVIIVLSIISVMMFRIMVTTSRENRNLLSRVDRARTLHLAMESLSRDLEAAVPFPRDGKVLFRVVNGIEGNTDSDRITLVIPLRQADGSIALAERSYGLQRAVDNGKVTWSLAWTQDAALDGQVEQTRGHVVTPLAGMQSVSLDVKVSPPGDNRWDDQWEPAATLPEKVQIRLRATDPMDPQHPLETLETVYLMAG